MLTAHDIAATFGGKAHGHKATIPGPGHSRLDASLLVILDPDAPDGFRVHSFAGDDFRDCRDYVKQGLGIATTGRDSPGAAVISIDRQEIERIKAAEAKAREAKRRAALDIWTEAAPLPRTLAASYLSSRIGGAPIPWQIIESGNVRFHPRPFFKAERYGIDPQAGEGELSGCAGALVARLVDPLSGAFLAVQRILLDRDGAKLQKWMLGGTGICKLCDPDQLGDTLTGLAIGEGLESSAAILSRYEWAPIWATMTAHNMATFPVLPDVEALTVFYDHDKVNPQTGKRAGTAAAQECASRWAAEAREVLTITTATMGKDFADIAQERARA